MKKRIEKEEDERKKRMNILTRGVKGRGRERLES